jgi:hypothetical protein
MINPASPTPSPGTGATTTSSPCREGRSAANLTAHGLVTPQPKKRPRSS